MGRINLYCDWQMDLGDVTEDVDLYVDTFVVVPSGNRKFLFLCEPRSILDSSRRWNTFDAYDCVLTHDQEVLDRCPNARLFEFGSTWISDSFVPTKEFSVSFVCGSKMMTEGHALRHNIWHRQDEVAGRKFFLSRHGGPKGFDAPVLGDSKEPLFDSQFHIAIENARLKYYFTEKLVDCLVTRTVPIYWGCRNVGDYFNTDGMILVDSAADIVSACRSLTPETYAGMLPAVEDNFQRAQQWKRLGPRVTEKIQSVLDEKGDN